MNRMVLKAAKEALSSLNSKRMASECMRRLSECGGEEATRRLPILEAEVEATELALSSLSKRQYDILREFYIEREAGFMDRLCEMLCCGKSTVYRHKRNALRAFAMRMFGSVD